MTDLFKTLPECKHNYDDVFPTTRTEVYNKTFCQRVPANPNALLQTKYGPDWKTPLSSQAAHGGKPCSFGGAMHQPIQS